MKKIYIDSSSSGEERENQVVTKIKQVDYHNYLLGNILNFKHINNADEFKTKLGLILHNLADRLFKSSIINNTYQNIKATKLSLSTEKYNKILDDIKTVFNKQLNQLFINYNKENPIIDDDYIDLFNFIFDRNLKLLQTFILKDTITIANVREILLKELQNSTINLKPLFKNPLEINSTFNNVGEILSYSKLNTRNIKNTLKYIKIQEANNYNSSTVYKISNSQLEVFTDIHILHYKTSNVQTEKFGFGTYKEIFQEISNNEPYKKNIIKRIFEVVQNKEHDNLIELPKKLNNFAEQLTHLLFIIEMQRNNATLFTAPIFLELVAQDSKYLKTDFFPMATHTAVSQARGIAYSYPLELPNSYFMDYDTHNVTQGNLLLRQEGHVFVEWLQKVMGNDKLNNITQIFNLIYTKKVLQEKEIDSIKLQEIQAFLGSIGKLKNYPANLIKVLEENLHNLIPHFGSRPEQYLLLFKEALLKKTIFSKKVKDLIENTFFEFQKILPKLDSFLVKVQADLKKDIKKIIPEILQILCAKIKEWYNIDAPEYITNVKTVEELKNKEVLKDITAKINNSNSIFSQSGDKLKFSIPPIKRKLVSTENINNKLLKTHNEENYDSSLDDAIKEYYKIMGEDSSSISL